MSWENTVTGHGTSRDKTAYSTYASIDLTRTELDALYESWGLAWRIVDVYPSEALREGFLVDGKVDEGLAALGVEAAVHEASSWSRLYGGGVIVVGINDGRELEQPAGKGDVDFLQVYDRYRCVPTRFYGVENLPKAGKPSHYQVFDIGTSVTYSQPMAEIHESRVVVFDGEQTTPYRRRAQLGWGDPVLRRTYEVLLTHANAWSSASALLADASQGVLKIKGLLKAMATNKAALESRIADQDLHRSVLKVLALDADSEDFTRVSTSFTSVPEMLDRAAQLVSAITGIPMTVLFGISPAGMNATGQSDTQHWYDAVASWRRSHITPQLTRLVRLCGRQGAVTYPPLWQPTALEKAQIQGAHATRDVALINAQVLLPEEVAESRFSGPYDLNGDVVVDASLRVAAEAEQEPAAPRTEPEPAVSLEAPRTDEFDPNQPRDESGKWGAGGPGGAKSAVKAEVAKTKESLGKTKAVYAQAEKTTAEYHEAKIAKAATPEEKKAAKQAKKEALLKVKQVAAAKLAEKKAALLAKKEELQKVVGEEKAKKVAEKIASESKRIEHVSALRDALREVEEHPSTEAEGRIREASKALNADISVAQRKALLAFSSSHDHLIRAMQRGKTREVLLEETKTWLAQGQAKKDMPDVAKKAEELVSTAERAVVDLRTIPTVKSPDPVYRGISVTDRQLERLLTAKTFNNLGMSSSSSTDLDVAAGFASSHLDEVDERGDTRKHEVVLKILGATGTPMAHPELSHMHSENEFLLKPDAKYRVVRRAYETTQGVYLVEAEEI